MKAALMLALGLLACSDANDAALDKLARYKDKVCACKDYECLRAARKELEASVTALGDGKGPSEAQLVRMGKLNKEISSCISKLEAAQTAEVVKAVAADADQTVVKAEAEFNELRESLIEIERQRADAMKAVATATSEAERDAAMARADALVVERELLEYNLRQAMERAKRALQQTKENGAAVPQACLDNPFRCKLVDGRWVDAVAG